MSGISKKRVGDRVHKADGTVDVGDAPQCAGGMEWVGGEWSMRGCGWEKMSHLRVGGFLGEGDWCLSRKKKRGGGLAGEGRDLGGDLETRSHKPRGPKPPWKRLGWRLGYSECSKGGSKGKEAMVGMFDRDKAYRKRTRLQKRGPWGGGTVGDPKDRHKRFSEEGGDPDGEHRGQSEKSCEKWGEWGAPISQNRSFTVARVVERKISGDRDVHLT